MKRLFPRLRSSKAYSERIFYQSECIETSIKKSSKRIAFIDALRGFTMILVVWHHVADYSFGLHIEDSLLMEIFIF